MMMSRRKSLLAAVSFAVLVWLPAAKRRSCQRTFRSCFCGRTGSPESGFRLRWPGWRCRLDLRA
jgi:hypothetical protein